MSVTETTAETLPDIKLVKEKFGDEEIEVIYKKARTPISPSEGESADISAFGFSPDLNQRTYIAEPGILCEQDVPVTLRDGTVDLYRYLPPRGRDECSRDRQLELFRQAAAGEPRVAGDGRSAGNGVAAGQVRVGRSRLLVPSRLCHRQSRSARRLPFPGRHQHVRHPGRPRRLRLHRVAGHAALVERQGGDVRQLRRGHGAISHRRRAAAASYLHRSLGGHRRSLSRIALRRRHSVAGLQQLYRQLAGRLRLHRRQQRHGLTLSVHERVLGRQDSQMGEDQDSRPTLPHAGATCTCADRGRRFARSALPKSGCACTAISSGPIPTTRPILRT